MKLKKKGAGKGGPVTSTIDRLRTSGSPGDAIERAKGRYAE